MNKTEIEMLYAQAQQHVAEHGCSAHPYQYAWRLAELAHEHKPKQILEVGTGSGYTALVMAKTNPSAHITTIEKDAEHVKVANEWFAQYGVEARIRVERKVAEEYLPALNQTFDLIFFDGYGIHYEFLPQYHRLLSDEGVAVIANNQLTTRTSDQFFSELHNPKLWRILEQFGDTTVAVKAW